MKNLFSLSAPVAKRLRDIWRIRHAENGVKSGFTREDFLGAMTSSGISAAVATKLMERLVPFLPARKVQKDVPKDCEGADGAVFKIHAMMPQA